MAPAIHPAHPRAFLEESLDWARALPLSGGAALIGLRESSAYLRPALRRHWVLPLPPASLIRGRSCLSRASAWSVWPGGPSIRPPFKAIGSKGCLFGRHPAPPHCLFKELLLLLQRTVGSPRARRVASVILLVVWVAHHCNATRDWVKGKRNAPVFLCSWKRVHCLPKLISLDFASVSRASCQISLGKKTLAFILIGKCI